MTKEIIGYYSSERQIILLLTDFERTVSLVHSTLIRKFGNELSEKIGREVRMEYENLLPTIPYTKGARSIMFNRFILITAQSLAAYRVLSRYNMPPEEIWEICYEALCLRLKLIPLWKRRLINKLWNSIFRRIVKRRGRHNRKEYLGSFELEYIPGNGTNFDFGINYTTCGNYNFLKRHDGEEFAPYICLSDIALSDAFGWGLIRTRTLADGCSYCDFRFKKGADTKISSNSDIVQATIDKIVKKKSVLLKSD